MSRALILMYHIVDTPRSQRESKYCCTPQRFAEQMAYLRRSNLRPLSLPALFEHLSMGNPFPDGSVAVTFDDGFVATYRNALPILKKYNIPATMFMLSDRLAGSNDWMHTRGFPERELMSQGELLAMRDAGVCIGSHTRTHPRLTEVDASRLQDELAGSREILSKMLGEPVRFFAYPFGLLNAEVRSAVQMAGYDAACSTRSGFNRQDADRLALRRLEVYGSDPLWKFKQKLKFGMNDASLFYPLRYYAGRVAAKFGLSASRST